MTKLIIRMMATSAMLFTINASGAENSPEEPSAAKISKDDFLPDWDFSGKVYQVTANPIIWSDDRSLAVIYDETASGSICYTFWCLKRTAQGTMAPIAKYMIWTDLIKKGILLHEQGLTVLLEGSRGLSGTTKISHYFPFTIPQAQISFKQRSHEHLNGSGDADLNKEWKHFLGQ